MEKRRRRRKEYGREKVEGKDNEERREGKVRVG